LVCLPTHTLSGEESRSDPQPNAVMRGLCVCLDCFDNPFQKAFPCTAVKRSVVKVFIWKFGSPRMKLNRFPIKGVGLFHSKRCFLNQFCSLALAKRIDVFDIAPQLPGSL
jgi:hypothetical protein